MDISLSGMELGTLVAVLLPVLLLQLGLMAFTLIDLIKRDESELRHLPKAAWAVIIIVVNFIGPVAYLLLGRDED